MRPAAAGVSVFALAPHLFSAVGREIVTHLGMTMPAGRDRTAACECDRTAACECDRTAACECVCRGGGGASSRVGGGCGFPLASSARVQQAEQAEDQEEDRADEGGDRGYPAIVPIVANAYPYRSKPRRVSPWKSVCFWAASVWQLADCAAWGSEHFAMYWPLTSE